MKSKNVKLIVVAAALGLASTAQAGFVNGGFETGDFTGWLVEYGKTSNVGFPSSGVNTTFAGHQAVIGATADPYSPFDTPFNGNFMARLNIAQTGADKSRISQTGTMLAGETEVFINWGAVLEDPQHAAADQPFFSIIVQKNGVEVYNFTHTAGSGGNVGWTVSPAASDTFYKSGQAQITGLAEGDKVTVILTVQDCDLSGHFGYAYLDGIGTVAEPPPDGNSVPDSGATLLMLVPAFFGLIALRRKK